MTQTAENRTPSPQTVAWTGRSGTKYTYYVYPLPVGLNEGQDGNYIYTKIENNSWTPVYIGQGDLGMRTKPDLHHQGACLKSKVLPTFTPT